MIVEPRTIGFPRAIKESGEKEEFLPEFIQFLARSGVAIFIEEGYGSYSGYSFVDYRQDNKAVYLCSRQEAFQKDIVVTLPSPEESEFGMLGSSSCLVSILNYSIHPERTALLDNAKIKAVSLDSIVDDNGTRLVEDIKTAAWNGIRVAFNVLEKYWPELLYHTEPARILVLGTGMVGRHAIDAATKMGNVKRNNEYIENNKPGVLVTALGRNITHKSTIMEKLFRQTDILVDATNRQYLSKPVVPNSWIAWLPEHAIILDLAADPYFGDKEFRIVRGIEGIPLGNLSKYVFLPGDPDWETSIPASIPSEYRRIVASSYIWEGIDPTYYPDACMTHYAQQLSPFMEILMTKGYSELSSHGCHIERALYRSTIHEWLRVKNLK